MLKKMRERMEQRLNYGEKQLEKKKRSRVGTECSSLITRLAYNLQIAACCFLPSVRRAAAQTHM